MSARIAQSYIALVFLGLGGWALFGPGSVIDLGFTELYRENTFTTRFIMACFGAQAGLFGAMALIVTWTARGFLAFAVLLLPFFWFNYHYHYVLPVLTPYGMIDFAGNLTMLIAALVGWRAARREGAAA
ncbi:MAG: hypothetical protein AAFQ90_13290 [Pseudomonadota bacterium]